ncbi:DAK2 domain-containing protein [Corynebacterium bouchesdurhonense]|uniref:DAK2 domain-containing protein n=1 Tax=Corynebacterium bouchesdurhonense TaxID=1720192 RepID=UPI0008358121|nr:DAK2 domain-containing protein [Corynebacterium bouchesdurhonense]
MATPPAFDGALLVAWARAASTELDARRVEINKLNVFPVPDADTGSNMAHTMAAAVAEADRLPAGAGAQQIAEALAVGAVKGARGNSGVVLSQVMRGVAQSVTEDTPGATVIADALRAAVKFVDRAIADPVEGTVITVLRAASAAATDAAAPQGGQDGQGDEDGASAQQPDMLAVAEAAAEAARVALAHTPSQLEALREADVVDAGGTGLVVLLEALVGVLSGENAGGWGASTSVAPSSEGHGAPGYLEVMFMFEGDLDALEGELRGLGDSLVIARLGKGAGKVHIHTRRAGEVIELAFRVGRVSELRLEVLPPQPATRAPERLILALTPPGSLAELYRQAGALTVHPGPDAVSDILSTVRRSGAHEVLLLPNGLLSQRELGAVEKAARAFEQAVTILPTVRLVSGIAALTIHDPDQPLATAAFAMSEAAGEMRTAVAHRAPRAGLLLGGAVAKGDVVVTTHGQLVLVADDAAGAIERTCHQFLERGGEQILILFDPDEVEAEALEEIGQRLGVETLAYAADGLGAIAEIGVE